MLRYLWAIALLPVLFLFASTVRAADENEVVLTKDGVPLKVVVRQDTAIYESADKASNNKPVKMFKFFYVLKPGGAGGGAEVAPTKNDFYRIGTGITGKEEEGWIHKDDVVEWAHRQALQLRSPEGREPAEFYKNEEELKGAYTGKTVEAFSHEPKGGGGVNLVPILKRFEFPDAAGDKVEGYQIAYLHSRSGTKGSTGGAGGEMVGTVDLSKSTLDVVFVIDTTASMTPFIEGTKEVVARIAQQLAKDNKGVPIRFGLIGYRDVIANPGEDWYVSRVFCDLEQGADHTKFQTLLGQMKEATQDSEDYPEDVFAGMKKAVKESKWNPNAFKHIILIGDASAQTAMSGPKNAEKLTVEGVLALAQPRGQESIREKIAVHAVRVIGQDPTDLETAKEHFTKLSSGEDIKGLYREFEGKQGAAAQFVDELVDIVKKGHAGLGAIKAGGTANLDTPGLGLLLQMARAGGETGATTGPAADVPQFASGFACETDKKGNQMFEPYVLAQHGQLELFASALDFLVKSLQQAGEPGSRDVEKVVQSLQILATQINLGEKIDPEMTPAKLLGIVLGFPVRNKIFDVTFAKLAAMTESDFQSWVTQVKASETIIRAHLDNPKIWFSLGETDAPMAKRHTFLKVKDLP